MTQIPPPDLPHLLYEALSQIGWVRDADALADRLKRLHAGLPKEDEFAVVCTWLGRCALLHKLDQAQAPLSSKDTYQVPDLLAVFHGERRTIPVLIEVKSERGSTLSFQPGYVQRLKSYAAALKLPILIAWKHHDVWALFDIDHMAIADKNYNITFGAALQQTLLGVLAGDFMYTLPRGVGVHLRMRKNALVASTEDGSQVSEEWQTTIDDVYYTDRDGRELRELRGDMEPIFYAATLELTSEATPTHIHQHYTVQADASKFAHAALVALLRWYTGEDDSLNWREVVARRVPVPAVGNFTETVKLALRDGFVQYVFAVQPTVLPTFLGGADAS